MIKVSVKPGFFFSVSVAVLVLPIKWTLCWLMAACFHELGHYLALRFMDTKIYGVTIGWMGAVMETEPLRRDQLIICALAGPFSGLLLTSLMRWYPVLSFCAVVQSCFNLLPLMPLDGGRIMSAIIAHLSAEKSKMMVCLVEMITFVFLVIAGVYLTARYSLGLFPLLLVVFFFIRRKYSCKDHG